MSYQPTDPFEILTRGRLRAAITTLRRPDIIPPEVHQLTHQERAALTQAVAGTDHPFTNVALGLLDSWDQLPTDDQAAGLLLVAAIARQDPANRRLPDRTRRPPGRGIER